MKDFGFSGKPIMFDQMVELTAFAVIMMNRKLRLNGWNLFGFS